MAPEIVTGRENIGNSGDHTSERPQAPPPPKLERRDNGLHHGPEHMRAVVAGHKAEREQRAEREIAALQGRLEKISEDRPPAPPRPSSPSKTHRLSYQNGTVAAEKGPRQPLVEVMPANTDVIPATRPHKTGFLSSMGEKLRGFAGVIGLVTLLGGDKPASGETPHPTTPTTNTRPSTATATVKNTLDTKVGADFSVRETTPKEAEFDKQGAEAPEIIGRYTVEEGDGFYISAKRALRDVLEKSGPKKEEVLQSIRNEYPDLANIKDEKKLIEQWAMKEGEKYGTNMQKGGGYTYKLTIFEGDIVQVSTDADGYPTTEVLGGKIGKEAFHPGSPEGTLENKTTATPFDVHDGGQKRTFAPGDTVAYTSAQGKKAEYTVKGPSEDGGLILEAKDSKRTFAISDKGLKRISDKEAPYRLVTPPGQSGQKPNETPVNGVDLNPTPAEPPAPEDESGLMPIDTGRPPAMKTYPVNSDFSKSETRVRKEPNSVEEALLGNGTVPENDPARARAMIAWHELDLALSQSFLGYPEEYKKATEEALKFTQELLAKGEIQQTENTYNRLAAKLHLRAEVKKAAEGRLSIFFRKVLRGEKPTSAGDTMETVKQFFDLGRQSLPQNPTSDRVAGTD